MNYLESIEENSENITLVTANSNLTLPFHSHKKGQLCYAEGGATFLVFKDKTYLLPSRHYSWIPAGVEHNIWHKYKTESNYIYYIPNTIIPENPFYQEVGIYPVSPMLLEMIHFTQKWSGDLLPGSFSYKFIDNLISLLAELGQESLPFSLPTCHNTKMNDVLTYIRNHLHQKLTLEKVSEVFNTSERTLSRNFQTHLKISFYQYLKMARIIKATEMLLQQNLSISEIAYEMGYESISSFSNSFYGLIGKRPSEFRDQNK